MSAATVSPQAQQSLLLSGADRQLQGHWARQGCGLFWKLLLWRQERQGRCQVTSGQAALTPRGVTNPPIALTLSLAEGLSQCSPEGIFLTLTTGQY